MDYKRHIGWYYEIGGNKAANQKKITGDAEKFHIVEGHRKKSGPLPFRDKFITKQSEKYQLKIGLFWSTKVKRIIFYRKMGKNSVNACASVAWEIGRSCSCFRKIQ